MARDVEYELTENEEIENKKEQESVLMYNDIRKLIQALG